MKQNFDLVVVGTGVAASTVAGRCRKEGWSVAVIDSRPFGGTCALRGCDPKKVLVGVASLADWARRMQGKGFDSGRASLDWPALMRFKRTFTDPVPESRERDFAEQGIAAFHGRARFEGPAAIRVGEDLLSFRSAVIAAGAAPARLHIEGESLLATSDDFLELERMPARIVFIGGGYIAFEFAHIAARAGAAATILHRGERPLELFDPDLVGNLVAHTRSLGIRVELGTEAAGVVKNAQGLVAVAKTKAGEQRFPADLVVHAAGRVPPLDDLNLASANVEAERRGVKVNEFLQSITNPAIYAAGDAAASGAPLTPVAGYEGSIAADNLIRGNHRKLNYAGLASVVFTIPPLTAVGMHEEAARAEGLRFRRIFKDTTGWYSSRRIAEECSGFKVIIEEETGRILGAHVLGEGADEVINVFALAIRTGLRADSLRDVLWAYPTHGSNLQYMV